MPFLAAENPVQPCSGAAPGRGSFLDFPLKGYRLHYQVGLFATYRLMQLVLPDMLELGRGGIVNISSLAAFIPGEGPYERPGTPTGFAYGGNKAAMHHLTEAVAFEMADRNIAVNALLPSEPVLTPGNLVAIRLETPQLIVAIHEDPADAFRDPRVVRRRGFGCALEQPREPRRQLGLNAEQLVDVGPAALHQRGVGRQAGAPALDLHLDIR